MTCAIGDIGKQDCKVIYLQILSLVDNDFMDEKQLIKNMLYLLAKYLHDRNDLADLIQQDSDSVKYILSEINKLKQTEYDDADLALIKEISFYFL